MAQRKVKKVKEPGHAWTALTGFLPRQPCERAIFLFIIAIVASFGKGTKMKEEYVMNNLEKYYLERTYGLFSDCLNLITQEDVRSKMEHALNELKAVSKLVNQIAAEAKPGAALELGHEVWNIADKLRKSSVILQQMSEGYFTKYIDDNEDDRLAIVWEFKRNGILLEIIYDYVVEAKQLTEALEEMAHAANFKEAV